jgi:hypothetical protein
VRVIKSVSLGEQGSRGCKGLMEGLWEQGLWELGTLEQEPLECEP